MALACQGSTLSHMCQGR